MSYQVDNLAPGRAVTRDVPLRRAKVCVPGKILYVAQRSPGLNDLLSRVGDEGSPAAVAASSLNAKIVEFRVEPNRDCVGAVAVRALAVDDRKFRPHLILPGRHQA